MKTAIQLIADERARQISKFGWTPKHDDGHTDGSLRVNAALCACDGTDAEITDHANRESWGIVERHGYNGEAPDALHLLAIAGALIVAEMERIQRRDRS